MSAGSILPHTKQHPVWSVRHNCHIPARLWNLRCTPHQIPFHIFCNSFCERCRVVPKHFCFRPPDAVHLYSGLRPLLIFLLFPVLPICNASCSVLRWDRAFYPGKNDRTLPYGLHKKNDSGSFPVDNHTSDCKVHPRSGNPGCRSRWTHRLRQKIRYYRILLPFVKMSQYCSCW